MCWCPSQQSVGKSQKRVCDLWEEMSVAGEKLHFNNKKTSNTDAHRISSTLTNRSVLGVKILHCRSSRAVPACNVERPVDWNHQVVLGAIEDGWTHRKANRQT